LSLGASIYYWQVYRRYIARMQVSAHAQLA
jgi:hypothetical protein